jgi:hypothetical protein
VMVCAARTWMLSRISIMRFRYTDPLAFGEYRAPENPNFAIRSCDSWVLILMFQAL